jgi:hypothetical protein
MRSRPHVFLLAVLIFAGCASAPPQRSVSDFEVLFIGNSYTYYNGLPTMLAELTTAAGSPRQIHTKAVTIPAATLQLLWEGGTAKEAIQERKWDFVVLQERRDLPARDPERMYTYARRFDAEIKKNGARTILFLTWAQRGRPEMQLLLNQAYFSLAKELDARVAPVGPAWQVALELAPGIRLHMPDGFHPTPTGTYLTACVFYLVMLGNQQQCPPIERFGIWQDDVAVARRAAFQASTTMP